MMVKSSQPAVKKIGELLVAKGAATRIAIEHALRQQKLTGEFLGTILIHTGAIEASVFWTY